MGAQAALVQAQVAPPAASPLHNVMAVNPTLARDETNGEVFPLPKTGEVFALKRQGIAFQTKLASGHQLSGTGTFFLSNKRIVFVASVSSCRPDFKSFEISLGSLYDPSFKQPIFGANYLAGIAGPTASGFQADPASAPLGGVPAPFTLTFNEGGCQTFVDVFFKIMADVQQDDNRMQRAMAQGQINSVAYYDPSDPSVLYVSQPQAQPGTEQEHSFETGQSAAQPSAPAPLQVGESAEIVILDGRYAGNWVSCEIWGPGSEAGKYRVFINETDQYNRVGGFAGQEIDNIDEIHLRRPGTEGRYQPRQRQPCCRIC